ncbi:MAG: hypothetical protein H6672_00345 [Anaerolineaceae bacterium]|nr:hypothetical protein [Anaerolineaceae bacterium]
MRQLVLEYVFEGHKRGYNFTSSTQGFSDATLNLIWRSAMPRGQGWGANGTYTGAKSLKCFSLADGRFAASDVIVTDLRDESGRGGIRRAVIDVLPESAFQDYLRERLAAFSPVVHAAIAHKPSLWQRKQIFDRTLPKMGKDAQLVFTAPYQTPDGWQTVEALVLKLILAPLSPLKRWGRVVPFTTLALDYRDESAVVVLPTDRAERLNGGLVVSL